MGPELLFMMFGALLITRWVSSQAGRGHLLLRWRRGIAAALGCCMMLWALVGCGGASRRPVVQKLKTRSLLNVKGLSVFPLESNLIDLKRVRFPKTREQFVDALGNGLRGLVVVPEGVAIVSTDGPKYPTLRRLRIDLSQGAFNDTGKTPKWSDDGHLDPGVHTDRLEVIAQPMIYRKASINIAMSASDVELDVRRDKSHNPSMMLTDAVDGHLQVDVGRDDLETLIKSAADDSGAKYLISVDKAKLKLQSPNDRALKAELLITARQLLVTATVRITGQIDIDKDLNARISNLKCNGEGVVGTLVCGIVGPSLEKNNGRIIPLTAFPSGNVRLHDLRVHLDDSLHITGTFGRDEEN